MKSKTLKRYIKEFDFENPNWDRLPGGFPDCEREALTKVEKHYLEAIEVAWLTTTKVGRRTMYRKFTRASLLTVAMIIIGFLAQFVIRNPESSYSKGVNAATISATLKRMGQKNESNESKKALETVIESTMSAVYRRN